MTKQKNFVYIELTEDVQRWAGWQNGYAEDCKSLNIGSIPVPASSNVVRHTAYSDLAQR